LQELRGNRRELTALLNLFQIAEAKARRKSTRGSKIPSIIRRLPFLRFVFGRLIGLGTFSRSPRLSSPASKGAVRRLAVATAS
jgi:hypothetical protein